MIIEEVWTKEEENTLKYLREHVYLERWNLIAQKMWEDYNFP